MRITPSRKPGFNEPELCIAEDDGNDTLLKSPGIPWGNIAIAINNHLRVQCKRRRWQRLSIAIGVVGVHGRINELTPYNGGYSEVDLFTDSLFANSLKNRPKPFNLSNEYECLRLPGSQEVVVDLTKSHGFCEPVSLVGVQRIGNR